jgi:5'-3' exonuclease
MTMKLHLVDGTYELFRSHFGAPSRKAPDGREVGATLGLLNSLLALLTKSGATHVVCAFDHVIESFRNDLFPGYKTSVGVAPELLAQFPLAEQALAALGVVVWPMVAFEADDALASAVTRFRIAAVLLGSGVRLFDHLASTPAVLGNPTVTGRGCHTPALPRKPNIVGRRTIAFVL